MLTHYYVSRYGENIIYMATHITEEPAIGCLRYIFRGNGNVLTRVPAESRTRGGNGLEGGPDVFSYSNGTTTSKYYGNEQAKDLTIKGATGNGVGVFMAYGSRETCIGGPFYRDIQFQSGGDTEIYNDMNHAIGATENYRMGLYGPYAYIFTTGNTPAMPDYSWMSALNLKGWVSWTIPASYLNAGNNTISIEPISGNADMSKFLSASFAYDCVELLN